MATQKRIKRQSSKPIFGWLQKKLGGASRAPREAVRQVVGERPRAPTLQQQEILSRYPDVVLNDDETSHFGRSTPPRSSRSSTWSPKPEAADDDASIRPLPPTSPPSPAPSRSSSSYLSDPRTFKSMTASTKPTTLISIDLATNGMAHIAQAPPTPITAHNSQQRTSLPRFSTSSISVSNSTSITFSALPPTSPLLRPSEVNNNSAGPGGVVQAPLHTSHHPRYNPRPSSPPQDNASVVTLASSAFGLPGGRGWVGGDSQSQLAADYNSQHGGDLEVDDAQVEYASVRALRPRSSRRGSWESEVSGWSAKIARERSLRASSFRTGAYTDVDGGVPEATGEAEALETAKKVQSNSSPLMMEHVVLNKGNPLEPSATEEDPQTPPAKEVTIEPKYPEETGRVDITEDITAKQVERTPTKKRAVDAGNSDPDEDGMKQSDLSEEQEAPALTAEVRCTESKEES